MTETLMISSGKMTRVTHLARNSCRSSSGKEVAAEANDIETRRVSSLRPCLQSFVEPLTKAAVA
jgi:hypothetical protein